jgi:hypothetical protein
MVSCLDLEVDRAPGANAGGSVTIDLDEKSRPHEALKTTDQFIAGTERLVSGARAACALSGRSVSAGERGRFVMSERGVAVALDADAERGCKVDGPC